MSRRFLATLLFLTAACASTGEDDPVTVPLPPPQDPQVAQLQTSLTELLERIDVLNDRIARLEERGAAPVTGAATAGTTRPAAAVSGSTQGSPVAAAASRSVQNAELAEIYRRAISSYGSGRAAEARPLFQRVFDADPTGDLADNALFWIGETWFAAGDNANAMRYYRRVIDEFGEENKAPDAMYKLALAQAKTGDLALARTTLNLLIERYPYSTSAGSAKQELKRIQY